MPRPSRYRWAVAGATVTAGAIACALSWDYPGALQPPVSSSLHSGRVSTWMERVPTAAGRALQAPADTPVRLSCAQAALLAMQARDLIAQPPAEIDPRDLAESTLDWLDPHGLWSAPAQAPVRAALQARAAAILTTLAQPGDEAGCLAARQLGAILHAWVDKLRGVFDQQLGIASGAVVTPTLCWSACSQAVFENGAVLRPADTLAAELGRRAGTFAATWGAPALFVAHQARKRMFPELDDFAWAEIILAAAFRSYVLLIDPHGAWAPFDEETSLYEVELEATGRHRLWSRMSRTAVGVRVDEDPVQPLRTGDVVITIDDVATAGLTVEQVEQLAVLDPADAPAERTIMVLRAEAAPLATLRVSPRPAAEPQQARVAPLQAERVAYRDGEVVVLNIEDVPDDLGEQLADTLLAARRRGKVTGLLLDLRGNGGGSIDGAKGAIGLFLPGAPLFPMRRRSGEIEVEIAPVPRATDRWKGPLAVLVDAETASAAEMIAGALRAYRRAIVLGARTFGKGCAQEYMDDDAGVGVLRLSTLVYALPDGSPVQRTGLVPDIPLDMGPTPDREDALPHAMRPWRGPDVRPKASATPVAWPSHAGRVGGCTDELVCRVLRALGTPRPASARWSPR